MATNPHISEIQARRAEQLRAAMLLAEAYNSNSQKDAQRWGELCQHRTSDLAKDATYEMRVEQLGNVVDKLVNTRTVNNLAQTAVKNFDEAVQLSGKPAAGTNVSSLFGRTPAVGNNASSLFGKRPQPKLPPQKQEPKSTVITPPGSSNS